jgi:hypothetical protein
VLNRAPFRNCWPARVSHHCRREPLIYLVTDSLVGVEFATGIQSDLRVAMPLAQLLTGGDIEGLAKELLRTMEARSAPGRTGAGSGTIQP